jgi:hypothetical protein
VLAAGRWPLVLALVLALALVLVPGAGCWLRGRR